LKVSPDEVGLKELAFFQHVLWPRNEIVLKNGKMEMSPRDRNKLDKFTRVLAEA
jgi:hypothetical protein